jgi:hypothetical protein
MRGRPLFDELVALTGVDPTLASGAVTRALAEGVAIDDATTSDYAEALPRLRARLKAYLPPDQAEERSQAILAHLTRITPGGFVRPRAKAQLADRVRGASDSSPPRSGERSVPPGAAAHGPWEDDAADISQSGRRWTADELAVSRTAREQKK